MPSSSLTAVSVPSSHEESILDVFNAHEGVIAFVGAGGKKSSIYRLASAHPGKVAVTSTVHTPPFRRRLNAIQIIAERDQLFTRLQTAIEGNARIAYAHPSDKPARLKGVAPSDIAHIHQRFGFDATFVKADGARLRWIKAPGQDEPVVPTGSSVLVPVLSIRALGKPLSEEVAHRAQTAATIMDMELGERITATHLARLLASDFGGLKNAGNATIIGVINMVENREELRIARVIAEQAMVSSARIDKVVIASMVRDDPILEIVRKQS